MTLHYRTTITDVGSEVPELLDGGILILYAAGAPPELAEVSVLHAAGTAPSLAAPPVGAELKIGTVSTILTAVGELAWKKVGDLGHVVINFNGSDEANRPGELCASQTNADELLAALVTGAEISIES